MFTLCPDCKKSLPVTIENLRKNRGIHICSNCSTRFDSLEFLSELPEEYVPTKAPDTPLPWEPKHKVSSSLFWGLSLTAVLLGLIAHMYYFENNLIVQNNTLRPLLATLCQQLNCQLPAYRNLEKITVLQGDFSPASNTRYKLQAVFANHAAFPQPFPKLHLTLLNFNGKPFAQETFSPNDYLAHTQTNPLISVNEQIQVDLNIKKPKTPVGGYTIEFL